MSLVSSYACSMSFCPPRKPQSSATTVLISCMYFALAPPADIKASGPLVAPKDKDKVEAAYDTDAASNNASSSWPSFLQHRPFVLSVLTRPSASFSTAKSRPARCQFEDSTKT